MEAANYLKCFLLPPHQSPSPPTDKSIRNSPVHKPKMAEDRSPYRDKGACIRISFNPQQGSTLGDGSITPTTNARNKSAIKMIPWRGKENKASHDSHSPSYQQVSISKHIRKGKSSHRQNKNYPKLEPQDQQEMPTWKIFSNYLRKYGINKKIN